MQVEKNEPQLVIYHKRYLGRGPTGRTNCFIWNLLLTQGNSQQVGEWLRNGDRGQRAEETNHWHRNTLSLTWTRKKIIVHEDDRLEVLNEKEMTVQFAMFLTWNKQTSSLPTALTFVLFLPMLLLTLNAAIRCVPTTMVNGFGQTIAAPLTSLGLYDYFGEPGLWGFSSFLCQFLLSFYCLVHVGMSLLNCSLRGYRLFFFELCC